MRSSAQSGEDGCVVDVRFEAGDLAFEHGPDVDDGDVEFEFG